MKLILFDGDCSFCSKYIRTLLKLDNKEQLFFSSLQSNYAKELEKKNALNLATDSIIYLKNNKAYYKSSAIIEMITDLIPLSIILKLIYIIPRTFRDSVYDLFARHRKKILSRDSCPIMPEKYRNRFYY